MTDAVVEIVLVVALFGVAGCGLLDGAPPSFSSPRMTCEDSSEDGVGNRVVTQVSVKVTDPNDDLAVGDGLEGTFNGLPITMVDDDADNRFTWRPGARENRILCDGTFELRVEASDAAGHSTTFETTLTRGEG